MQAHHILSVILFLIAAFMQFAGLGYWGWWLAAGLMIQLWNYAVKSIENQNQHP
jgi:hypothetical protein